MDDFGDGPISDTFLSTLPLHGHYRPGFVTTYADRHLLAPQHHVEALGGSVKDHGHGRGNWPNHQGKGVTLEIASGSELMRSAGSAVIAASTEGKSRDVIGRVHCLPTAAPLSAVRPRAMGGSSVGAVRKHPACRSSPRPAASDPAPRNTREYPSGRFTPRSRHFPKEVPLLPSGMILREPVVLKNDD